MVIALVILAAGYLGIASLVALNSVLEAERERLTARDILVVALVCASWPLVGCALLSARGCRTLAHGKRQPLPTAR